MGVETVHPESINPLHFESLCQVSRNGMELAAIKLSRLLKKKIAITVAESWLSTQQITGLSQTEKTLSIFINVSGALNGSLLLALSTDAAAWLCQQLLGESFENDFFSEPASSTLKEVANIMASSFLANLDNQLGFRALPAPPTFCCKSLAELVTEYRSLHHEPCLVVQTLLNSEAAEAEPFQGAIYLLSDAKTLEQLIQRARNI